MRKFYDNALDAAIEHKVVVGLVVIALVLFLAYSLLG